MIKFLRRILRRKQPELVRYYDAETEKIVLIPKAELRPGVVLIKVQGESESMYADPSTLKPGPVQHPELPEEIRLDIKRLAADLSDVYPKSAAEWEDGFRRDLDPLPELAGWLHLAAILKVMAERYHYGAESKNECFRILVACYTGDRSTVRERSDPKLLAAEQVNEAIRYFFEGGYA